MSPELVFEAISVVDALDVKVKRIGTILKLPEVTSADVISKRRVNLARLGRAMKHMGVTICSQIDEPPYDTVRTTSIDSAYKLLISYDKIMLSSCSQ